MENKEIISQLSSYIGKLLRERFGKGPESIHISLDSRCVTLQLHNFIGPVEKLLLEQQKVEAFRDTRVLVMESLIPELSRFIEQTIGHEIEDMYYDWDLETHSGIVVGLFKSAAGHEEDAYANKHAIHERIRKVTKDCEKMPDDVHSFWASPKTLVIIREGLLVLIEKQLVELGYESTLRIAKRILEKLHFAKDVQIEAILDRTISGMYLDWKFDKDKSILVYTFKN
ncbi:DUF2294 domain-containing protein [Paenibacillus agricola]|uniref:DUF2294 family protein n=1 Tax=Paenibacillus agricola TaxID=2716264 RepID=A0ABX0JAH7_9BACL|nr:Na-translocating system protein MpsC family protein [Paenibacillus agricola]NHN31783.1 DUF2294 family protein [Paenibacillus agricola]